jgi:two-component system chemotaxis response regulator CheB
VRHTGLIKVLIVDDSALIRSMLSRVLAHGNEIEVVGGAKDPYEARELIIAYRPDVIILDIEMPRMDGLTFLKKLMKHYPIPVIMCSGVAQSSSRIALEAIEAGAVDVVCKPSGGGKDALERLGMELADKVRAAAATMPATPPIPTSAKDAVCSFRAAGLDPDRFIIGIGASTGGTEAIRRLLTHVGPDFPPIVMVQHMPEGFTQSFADRLNQLCPPTVSEAIDGDILQSGRAFLARGGIQIRTTHSGGRWRINYGTSDLVNRHCPSVDVLFDSLAASSGRQLIGILLTGMGADGAKGLLRMREAGALTFAQDRRSCIVYGMPKVAVELGAVMQQCPPADMARAVIQALQSKRPRPTAAAN